MEVTSIDIIFPITKQQLQCYRFLKMETMNQTERIERLRARLELVTPTLSDMPKSNCNDSKLPDGICQLMELEKLYEKQLKKLYTATVLIEQAIQELSNPLEREILRLRYIDCFDWLAIQYAISLERSQTLAIHGRALYNLGQISHIL